MVWSNSDRTKHNSCGVLGCLDIRIASENQIDYLPRIYLYLKNIFNSPLSNKDRSV